MSYTSDIPEDVQETVLGQMRDKWAKVMPEVAGIEIDPKSKVGILVRFDKGRHGDEQPFDGTGGTVGHAVYPDPHTGKAVSKFYSCK